MLKSKRLRGIAALALLAFSTALLGWGLWPASASTQILNLKPESLQMPTPQATASPGGEEGAGGIASEQASPALPEARWLALDAPKRIRQGDSANIRLDFHLDANPTITPTPSDSQVSGEPVLVPNVYETHRVIAQARLDLVGMEAIPAAGQTQMQPLLPGEEVSFYWSVRPTNIATYSGVVWFSLRYEPLDGGPAVEQMISAQPVEIESVNFVGLGGTPARLMGGAGILLGVLLSKDTTADFLKKFRNSRKTRSKTNRKHTPRKTRRR